ncbi:MAG: hypothetical protein PUE12_12840 [Oscillospiraceae bacterium]|nr:hypothetical protein [Oscillospiraceae bacterium]
MFKKITCIIASLVFAAVSFTGCSSTEKKTTTIVEEKSETKEVIHGNGHTSDTINLKLCADNVTKMFKDGDYGLNDISIDIPTKQDDFFNIIIITEEKPADNSVFIDMLEECLKALNDEAIKQDPEFSPTSDGYYGGLFDQYSVQLTAMCLDEILKVWPVNQKILAGKHDPIVTNNDPLDINGIE